MRLNSISNELNFESSVGHVLRGASPRIDVALTKVLEKDGLSYIQWVVLVTLCELGTSTTTELAHRFGYDTGSLSRLIDRLVRRDLIGRMRTDQDRRVVVLSITPQGDALVRSTLPRVARTWNGILRKFDDSEVQLLVSYLRRLEEFEVIRLAPQGRERWGQDIAGASARASAEHESTVDHE